MKTYTIQQVSGSMIRWKAPDLITVLAEWLGAGSGLDSVWHNGRMVWAHECGPTAELTRDEYEALL